MLQMAVAPALKQHAQTLDVKGCKTFKPTGSFAVGEFTVANALGVVQVLNNGHV